MPLVATGLLLNPAPEIGAAKSADALVANGPGPKFDYRYRCLHQFCFPSDRPGDAEKTAAVETSTPWEVAELPAGQDSTLCKASIKALYRQRKEGQHPFCVLYWQAADGNRTPIAAVNLKRDPKPAEGEAYSSSISSMAIFIFTQATDAIAPEIRAAIATALHETFKATGLYVELFSINLCADQSLRLFCHITRPGSEHSPSYRRVYPEKLDDRARYIKIAIDEAFSPEKRAELAKPATPETPAKTEPSWCQTIFCCLCCPCNSTAATPAKTDAYYELAGST